MIKMAAFDLDGTIGDTIPMCIKAFEQAVSPYAGHRLKEEEIVQTFGLNERGMIRKVLKNTPDTATALEDFYRIYEKEHENCSSPYAGMMELIHFLKIQGIPVALVTGKGKRSCSITLEKFGMQDLFCSIKTGAEDRNNKAESIAELRQAYGIKKGEFIYVGDTVSDIAACREAGVQCLSAAWNSTANIDRLEKENPSLVFSTIEGLRNFFDSRLANFHLQGGAG